MSFLSPAQLNELLGFAAIADKEARGDLGIGDIRDEDDYTSNFTGALRRIINANSESGLVAKSFLLKPRHERRIGADAAIVLSRGGESKVAVFEAKWPRFSIPDYKWDYEQTASGLSHFSDQLERQRYWSEAFAVFEMFYCEFPFGEEPSFLDANGSSCVWRDDAEKFRLGRRNPDMVWSQEELKKLLEAKRVTLAEVLGEFGLCKRGKPIPLEDPFEIDREFRLPEQVLKISASGKRTRLRE